MGDKNITFFQGNKGYKEKIQDLDTYAYCRMCIEHELRGCKSLLDIGNGGFFNYDISKIERVVALDLFIDEKGNYGNNVTPIQGNALNFKVEAENDEIEKFDTIVIQMLIHHVTGSSPKEAVRNIEIILQNCAKHLLSSGRILVIESTIPGWFYFFEKILFVLLNPVWNLPHPLVLQHTPNEIIRAARKAGLKIEEYTMIPKGDWLLQFGLKFPAYLTPVQPIKLLLSTNT